jgi:hypothetical protein
MAAFRFSRRAEADLLGIGRYTLSAWGTAQTGLAMRRQKITQMVSIS